MATQLEDHGTHWVVKTIETVGRRRRMARGGVRVEKGDPAALRTEVIRQAELVRSRHGVKQPAQELAA